MNLGHLALSCWWNTVCRSWIHPLVSAGLAVCYSLGLLYWMSPSRCTAKHFFSHALIETSSCFSCVLPRGLCPEQQRHRSSTLACEAHAENSCFHTITAFLREGSWKSTRHPRCVRQWHHMGWYDVLCWCTLWTYLYSCVQWEIVKTSWELEPIKLLRRGFLGFYVVSGLVVLHNFFFHANTFKYSTAALHFYFSFYLEGTFWILSRIFRYDTLVSQPQIKQMFNFLVLNYQQTFSSILFSFSHNDVQVPICKDFSLSESLINGFCCFWPLAASLMRLFHWVTWVLSSLW